jgi:hypothetical protein
MSTSQRSTNARNANAKDRRNIFETGVFIGFAERQTRPL